jgi:hypothetical protein
MSSLPPLMDIAVVLRICWASSGVYLVNLDSYLRSYLKICPCGKKSWFEIQRTRVPGKNCREYLL